MSDVLCTRFPAKAKAVHMHISLKGMQMIAKYYQSASQQQRQILQILDSDMHALLQIYLEGAFISFL